MTRRIPLRIDAPVGAELYIDRMTADERVSGLFSYDVTLVSSSSALDFEAILGAPVTITLDRIGDRKRHFHGIVGRFAQGGSRAGKHFYRATIRPSLWLLTHSEENRIHQAKTVPEIVMEVLDEHGISDVRNELMSSYPPREYCVQYRESAFDFISRLLEEEGIFYFFEHSDRAHTLVLADDASSHPPAEPLTIPVATAYPDREMEDSIGECGYQKQMVTGDAEVVDYNFETPAQAGIVARAPGRSSAGRFRRVEHPGGFLDMSGGERIARLRAEAQESATESLTGNGWARGFCAGQRFTLSGHERRELDREYVIRRVTHTISQEGYENGFEAVPADTPLRPFRRRGKPVVHGTQSAVIVGPQGEEIHTDRYGRVKVRFHWDPRREADEQSSCWMRVAQGWAGQAFGSFFLPRVGQEVLVSFIDGDIDRPIVTGSVYNASQIVPYPLPEHQTRSVIRSQTKGDVHNELYFEDLQDSEEIRVLAAKDFNAEAVNDRTWKVGHDSVEIVTNDRTTTISEGNERLIVSQGDRSVEIDEGNETITIRKGDRTLEIQTGNDLYRVAGDRTLEVTGDEKRSSRELDWTTGGDFTLKVTGDIVIDATGSITLKAGQDITVQATNALLNKGMNVTNDAQVALKNKAGATLDNEAGASLNSKSNGAHSVEAQGLLNVKSSGILNVQGSLVKIN